MVRISAFAKIFTVCCLWAFLSDVTFAGQSITPEMMKMMRSEHRVALVIGNSAYEKGVLDNPVNDARAMSKTLQGLGFEIIKGENLDYQQMDEKIHTFGGKLRRDGVGLFYYAGHGVQIGGKNYLIPVRSGIRDSADVKYKAPEAGFVLAKMQLDDNRVNIIILDACRNNPYRRLGRGGSSGPNGLAYMESPRGRKSGDREQKHTRP